MSSENLPADRDRLAQLSEKLAHLEERHARELRELRNELAAVAATEAQERPIVTPAVENHTIPEPSASVAAAPTAPKESNSHQPPPVKLPPPIPQSVKLPSPIPPADQSVATSPPASAQATEGSSFETRLGKVWFVRLGVVIFVTGLVLLGNYAYHNWVRDLPNIVRLLSLLMGAAVMTEAGRRLAKRSHLERFGEVVFAGGMAFFYYCAFAAHQVERLRVIESPVLAGMAVILAAIAIAAIAWKRQARATATLGLVLASYTTLLQPLAWLSCVSVFALTLVGVFFITKPGWRGPGWASMLGTYVALTAWQALGASGETDAQWGLGFTPVIWFMFALPPLIGSWAASLSERGKGWFTAINNGLFFLLFSHLWRIHVDQSPFWIASAIIGAVWCIFGIHGNREGRPIGAVSLSQGLAALFLAIVLKYEGHHLALALALASVGLSMAFMRWKGTPEAIFAALAALGASGMVLFLTEVGNDVPTWSLAVTCGMVALSGTLVWRGERARSYCQGAMGSLIFGVGVFVSVPGWIERLGADQRMLAALAVSAVLSLASVFLDRRRTWLMPLIAVLFYLLNTSRYLWEGVSPIAAAIAFLIVWLAGRAWQYQQQRAASHESPKDAFSQLAAASSIAYAGLIAWLVERGLTESTFDLAQRAQWTAAAGCGIAILAIATRYRAAAVSAAAVMLLAVAMSIDLPPLPILATWVIFSATLVLHGILWIAEKNAWLTGFPQSVALASSRVSTWMMLPLAWYATRSEVWFDAVALSAVIVWLAVRWRSKDIPWELPAWLGFAALGVWVASIDSPWTTIIAPTWRGGLVAGIAFAATLLMRRPFQRPRLAQSFAYGAYFTLALWLTQMVVWRADWKPIAIAWTLIGFSYVTLGLWRNTLPLRLVGLTLIALALGRVFLVDVWDLTAFMRVVSFIVLGAALMVLGLFYHQFSPMMKRLLNASKTTATKDQLDHN